MPRMDVPDERDVSVLDVPNLLDKANHLIELSAGEAPLPSIRQKLDEAGYLLEQADLELQTWAGN